LKTVAGSGDPMLREGLATHVYVANASMKKKAFVNNNLTCLHKQGPEFGLNVECSLLWNNEKFTIGVNKRLLLHACVGDIDMCSQAFTQHGITLRW
jgi:hypothetical protein